MTVAAEVPGNVTSREVVVSVERGSAPKSLRIGLHSLLPMSDRLLHMHEAEAIIY